RGALTRVGKQQVMEIKEEPIYVPYRRRSRRSRTSGWSRAVGASRDFGPLWHGQLRRGRRTARRPARETQRRDLSGRKGRTNAFDHGGTRRGSPDAGCFSQAGQSHVFQNDLEQADRHSGGNPEGFGPGG